MARQRDYKAERERSNELARQRGFRNAQEQRRARKAAEAEGRARAEATAEQYRERIARRRPARVVPRLPWCWLEGRLWPHLRPK